MADRAPNPALVSAPRFQNDAAVADICGEIDLHNSAELRVALLTILNAGTIKKLVLNLGLVPYMDSSAVAVLVETLQRLRRIGGQVILTGLQPRVRGLLEIARLDSIFVLVTSEADALSK